ncbi:hypothetical protein [Bradyrhizobium sp. WSM1743]|uniref:hypothetical protein n=1 Tax=Bradyrhizobium sp. WSM1743 TaxID=318996 RepID=UPI000414F1C7|nr:hypothetical protein [Bradyrhizobium sp. WSM1743]
MTTVNERTAVRAFILRTYLLKNPARDQLPILPYSFSTSRSRSSPTSPLPLSKARAAWSRSCFFHA